MADLIRMHGLVAAEVSRGQTPEAPGRPRPTAQVGDQPGTGGPAAELNISPGRSAGEEIPVERLRARQENIAQADVRAAALGEMSGLLAAASGGGARELGVLATRAGELGDRLQPGPELSKLLANIEPQSAAAVNPGMILAAQTETNVALGAAQGQAATERRGLALDLVTAENSVASRTENDRVDRAAAALRNASQPSQPADLVEALRDSSISRSRAVDLLVGGNR
jgi:hypothetical protein